MRQEPREAVTATTAPASAPLDVALLSGTPAAVSVAVDFCHLEFPLSSCRVTSGIVEGAR